jgi:hypothetical protein
MKLIVFLPAVYFTMLSVAGVHSIEQKDDRIMGNNLEGRSHGLIEVLSQHLPGETGENHRKLQSG